MQDANSIEIFYPNHRKPLSINISDYPIYKSHKWIFVDKYGWVAKGIRCTILPRVIMNCPKGLVVDHINGNRSDNRRINLRICTMAQNKMNRQCYKRPSDTSKYIGVSKSKTQDYFAACISVNNKTIHIGRFKTAEEAAKAYDKAAIKYRGEFANTNFPRSNYAI